MATLYSFMGLFHSLKGNPALGRKYQGDSFEEAEKIQDIEIMATVATSLCFSYMVEGNYREIANIAPKVIALLEKTQREHEFFGLPPNAYSVAQGFMVLAWALWGNLRKESNYVKKPFLLRIKSITYLA